ncbi:ABC transporter ATP-binding protein [Roseiflexus sp.]|uniref:ABC transporter ATP-binding protein n=1 Tax=Roseiflexus sp. TaxID=2562120 RepID=UPI00398B3962
MSGKEFTVTGAYTYDHRSPVRWVWSHVMRYPWLPIAFVVTVIGMAALQSWSAVLVGSAFDAVVGGITLEQLTTLALVILGVRVTFAVIDLANSFVVQLLAQLTERNTREELYISLLGKSLTFHNRQRTGDIMARATNDVQQINSMINPGLSLIIESLVSLTAPLIAISTIHPQLLLVPMLFLVSFAWALRRYNNQLRPVAGALRQQFGVLNAGLAETVSGVEVVKGYAQEPAEERKFSTNARRYRDLFVREGGVQARYLPLLLYGVMLGLAFGHALLLWRAGEISIGQIIGYMGLLEVLRFPTFISLFTFSLVQLGIAGAERMLTTITTKTELDENIGGYSAPIQGEIRFENVGFGYDAAVAQRNSSNAKPSAPVLRDITFTARPGETIAIVGQTGAGKTTLTRLVNRIYDATQGRVLIDGVNVREWNLDALRSQISTIEQDIFLFSRTIAENIAFGAAGNATREEIEWAARQAQAHDFIMSFPEGYDTIVGERGMTLSGGQRQRIAIARAFLTNPRILILDDSTSAIDSATEDQIQRAMRRILMGRTTLLITHRISQIRWADRILVLKNGRLVAQGTHDELIETSDAYRRIFLRYDAGHTATVAVRDRRQEGV